MSPKKEANHSANRFRWCLRRQWLNGRASTFARSHESSKLTFSIAKLERLQIVEWENQSRANCERSWEGGKVWQAFGGWLGMGRSKHKLKIIVRVSCMCRTWIDYVRFHPPHFANLFFAFMSDRFRFYWPASKQNRTIFPVESISAQALRRSRKKFQFNFVVMQSGFDWNEPWKIWIFSPLAKQFAAHKIIIQSSVSTA